MKKPIKINKKKTDENRTKTVIFYSWVLADPYDQFLMCKPPKICKICVNLGLSLFIQIPLKEIGYAIDLKFHHFGTNKKHFSMFYDKSYTLKQGVLDPRRRHRLAREKLGG